MFRIILILTTCLILLHGVESTGRRCRLGFIPFKKSCYWFSNIRGSFAEAGFMCLYMRGHLAVIKSRAEDNFIRGHLIRHKKGSHYFIGGTDLQLQGRFSWEGEDRPMRYHNWNPRQPNNYRGIEHCVTLDQWAGFRWFDGPCENRYNFICEIGS